MAIRMKEWGMLAAPGQPVHVRTQGLYGWERVGRTVGEGIGDAVAGGLRLAEVARVSNAGELASFTDQLKALSAEVVEELREQQVKDWDYAWNTAMAPRVSEAVQELPAEARESGTQLARTYVAQASIEARRDRELQRVASARQRWQQQVESSVAAGEEQQAARWMETGRGLFVPEEEMDERVAEVRSRACHSRWEARLQSAPLETLAELAEAGRQKKGDALPARQHEREQLEQSSARICRQLRRELAHVFSDALRNGEEPDAATLSLAVRAGLMASPGAGGGKVGQPSTADRSAWRRWLDNREEGEEGETEARLTLVAAPLPAAERRALLARLESSQKLSAADRRALSNRLFSLYHAGAFGCPGDAEAQRTLLALQEEGMSLLAEQGAGAASDWVSARSAGADSWVCFEPGER